MAVDFKAGYVPPGVYVSSDVAQSVGAVGLTPTVICLVGQGLGYRNGVQYVTFAAGQTSVQLTDLGITAPGANDPSNTTTSIFRVSSTTNGVTTIYSNGAAADYTVSQTGTGASTVTTVARVGTNIQSGTQIKIEYRYADSNYYALNSFSDYATFSDVYGPAYNQADGSVLSPLSLAAQVAFQNGANVVYAVAIAGGSGLVTQFTNAYQLSLNSYDINLVVPLLSDATSLSAAESEIAALAAHLSAAEDASTPRMALVGVAQGYSGSTPDALAQAIDNPRIVLLWPNSFLTYNPVLQTSTAVDGFYFAAGAAGVLANQNVNRGLTRSQVRAFNGIPLAVNTAQVLPSTRNTWSAAGVAVAEIDRLGRLVIRHGVTTDVSSIVNREISIVRSRDSLFTTIYQSLDQADLIGDAITDDTPLLVKGIVSSALEQALAADVIASYTDLVVRQQSLPTGDPTVIEVKFSYQPTYPLNYITVVFTVDLQTGSITAAIDTAAAA